MRLLRLAHSAPSHGWLSVNLATDDKQVEIDASDVPNNPIQDLIAALELAARGDESFVWWNLEPHGYYMYFTPEGGAVKLRLEFAEYSERARGVSVLALSGTPAQILLPFWRFIREFQSHGYLEPHWPSVDYSRVGHIKEFIARQREA